MIKYILVLLSVLSIVPAPAQSLIPFAFLTEDDNKLIRENDSVKFYEASGGDSSYMVSLNEEASYYKLLNKEHKVIAEGAYIVEGDKYLQDGKWIERYETGKIKKEGYFHRNDPIGTWQEFYPNGKLKIVSNYGAINDFNEIRTCLSGTYQEYYPSGKLKVNGFYSGKIVTKTDTIILTDPVTDQKVIKTPQHTALEPQKAGHWEYYTETGELDKKEDF